MTSDLIVFVNAYTRLHRACRTRGLHAAPGELAVSAVQADILGQLDLDDPTMVTELAEHLGVTPSTMSLNLKRLEGSGLVERSRDGVDRRVMNVTLTDAGARALSRRSLLDAARVDAMLLQLSPQIRREALRGLVLLAEAADGLTQRGRDYIDALTGS